MDIDESFEALAERAMQRAKTYRNKAILAQTAEKVH